MQTNKINENILARIRKIPIFDTLKFEIIELENGKCTAKVARQKIYDGIFETFHGGILMTIADSISAFAILTLAGTNSKIATTDMNIRFLSPCRTGVKAEAKVIRFGKTLCPVSVNIYDDDQKLVAISQVTYLRFD